MPDGREAIAVKVVGRIGEIDAADWDACAGGTNPFVSHAFLHALEESGSVGAESGWLPQHLVIEDENGRACACAPMYVKGHSQGEYVFDHGWADAFERAGGAYYPKLQVSVPFTPVTGPRLLVRPGPRRAELRSGLLGGMIEATRKYGLSSLHVTFPTEEQARFLADAGLLLRQAYQFHWINDGYEDFDGFLARLVSRKRKSIRRERRAVAASGLTLRALAGDAIEPRHWDAFYRFYVDTYDRKWGYPYLTRDFFARLSETMAENVMLVMVEDDGAFVAGALNYIGADAVYGRNWGCVADYKFLHFEACYYQAIDFAIARGLGRVEAGTQGPHKIQRGYLPQPTWSAHWIPDDGFRAAVADFLVGERAAARHEMAALARHSPFRCDSGDEDGGAR